jgi:signal transduction histidine kinase
VRTEIDGERRSLPASVDLTAYRIVQEAITNVIRHAGASRATVTLAYGEDELVVLIDDDGRGGDGAAQRARDDAATEGTGSGIAGMRDRAVALGGSLRAGPRPEGGFRVVAHLPLEERS